MPASALQIHVRIERRLVAEALRVGGRHVQACREHIRPARQQIDGQRRRHRQRGFHVEYRPLNRCIGLGARTGQHGQPVNRQIRGRLRLCARHACLRQLAFGLPQLEPRVESGRNPPARDIEDVLPLRLRALRDVRQRIFAVQLDIGLGDGAREHQLRVVHIQARGLGERLRAMHRIRLPPPEIGIPPQGGAGLAHPETVPGERRRDQIILRRPLIQRAGIEIGMRQQGGLRRLRLRQGLRHSRLRLSQCRAVLQSRANQPIQLRILK